ncbi:4-deoxy-4-formamido-L-arabinose-phosphoundecaprenol deformylase [Chitinimonas sp.]|uniref:4-deoxy-4-formamido-L-arabinose- phosphoundecaprenol deformylase n=1 Tax=Chitinimonas sp. TaxID=1934313 RepID=UPI002F9360B3
MLLALRIEVDSLAAARQAVPPLLSMLQTAGAQASFYFNMGPDRSGRARGPLFQVGEHKRQIRQNRQLSGPHGAARLYGWLLPSPEVYRQAGAVIESVKQAGYEVGVGAWDRVAWVKQIAGADQRWVRQELQAALHAYETLLGEPGRSLAAPGWRTNRPALRLEQLLGMEYGSDTRGTHPFLPVVDGEPIRVPQLPTTLPTLAELIGSGSHDEQSAVEALLARTAQIPLTGHVFTIHAARDGGKRLPVLQRLIAGWQQQGHELASLHRLLGMLQQAKLPWHCVEQRAWPGYAGLLSVQGEPFPGRVA